MNDENGKTRILGIPISHADRVLYPEQGVTKGDLARYYEEISGEMLPHIRSRPLSIVRCPEGRKTSCFYQKHAYASIPEEIDRVDIEEKSGAKREYLAINQPSGLVAAVQVGVLELHIWGCRTDRLERPDRIVFDLDPDPALPFQAVRDAAKEIRDVLDAAGLASFPLLTGGKGIHVVVPVRRSRTWDDVKQFARGLAEAMVAENPGTYVATAAKAKRKNRIFIDWLRNERGATAICPFSTRARAGAPIATPVGWDELSGCDSAQDYTINNISRRLATLEQDPWEGFDTTRQSITKSHLEFFSGQGDHSF